MSLPLNLSGSIHYTMLWSSAQSLTCFYLFPPYISYLQVLVFVYDAFTSFIPRKHYKYCLLNVWCNLYSNRFVRMRNVTQHWTLHLHVLTAPDLKIDVKIHIKAIIIWAQQCIIQFIHTLFFINLSHFDQQLHVPYNDIVLNIGEYPTSSASLILHYNHLVWPMKVLA